MDKKLESEMKEPHVVCESNLGSSIVQTDLDESRDPANAPSDSDGTEEITLSPQGFKQAKLLQ